MPKKLVHAFVTSVLLHATLLDMLVSIINSANTPSLKAKPGYKKVFSLSFSLSRSLFLPLFICLYLSSVRIFPQSYATNSMGLHQLNIQAGGRAVMEMQTPAKPSQHMNMEKHHFKLYLKHPPSSLSPVFLFSVSQSFKLI